MIFPKNSRENERSTKKLWRDIRFIVLSGVKTLNFLSLSFLLHAFTCMHAHATTHMWRSEYNSQESVLSSLHEGPEV